MDYRNVCYLGASVESGTAVAAVVKTGAQTYFGSMAGNILSQRVRTSFDRGVNRFTWLMMRWMAVLVPLVFLINGVTKEDWKGAFFFAWAVAVGLTPAMLPMIVSVESLIIHVIRTNRIPFLQSMASWPLLATSVLIMAVGVWLPGSPLGASLGFPPLTGEYGFFWPILSAILFAYVCLTQLIKAWLLRKRWI